MSNPDELTKPTQSEQQVDSEQQEDPITTDESVEGTEQDPIEEIQAPVAEEETPLSNAEVLDRIEHMQRLFSERARAYEDTIRSMHRHIEELQEDQVRSLLKPVFERLATLHAQADESSSQAREDPSFSPASAIKSFEHFKDSIEDLLSMLDVESVEAAPGQALDRKKHYAIRTKKTPDKSADKTIYRVQRQGFTFAGASRVMLPARVIAYSYDPALVPAENLDTHQHPQSSTELEN